MVFLSFSPLLHAMNIPNFFRGIRDWVSLSTVSDTHTQPIANGDNRENTRPVCFLWGSFPFFFASFHRLGRSSQDLHSVDLSNGRLTQSVSKAH